MPECPQQFGLPCRQDFDKRWLVYPAGPGGGSGECSCSCPNPMPSDGRDVCSKPHSNGLPCTSCLDYTPTNNDLQTPVNCFAIG